MSFKTDDPKDVHALTSKEVAAVLKCFVKAGGTIAALSIATLAVGSSAYADRWKSDVEEGDEELGSCIDLATLTCLIVRASSLPISIVSSAVSLKSQESLSVNGSVCDPADIQERITLSKRPVIQNLKLAGSSITCLGVLLDAAPLLDLHNLRSLDVDPTGDFSSTLLRVFTKCSAPPS